MSGGRIPGGGPRMGIPGGGPRNQSKKFKMLLTKQAYQHGQENTLQACVTDYIRTSLSTIIIVKILSLKKQYTLACMTELSHKNLRWLDLWFLLNI